MAAYCTNCQRFVNQSCDKCNGSYGVQMCEWYGCGGRMLCPICGGNNLTAKRKFVTDPYDFSKHKDRNLSKGGTHSDLEARYFAERKMKDEMVPKKGEASAKAEQHCTLCGYTLIETWKFCPECGVSLMKK